ncbi:MAG: response regulator [Fibrobacteria bacterium]|nr:response regulator [Fibrobacteria bacterium]
MTYKILLADDEPDIVRTVRKRLEISGFEVATAQNGLEALEKLKEFKPDLVVLDVMMPELNGHQVCRTIREAPDTCDLPVIMLTAKAQESDKFWGGEVGASLYITKPFDDKVLISKIKELLENPLK